MSRFLIYIFFAYLTLTLQAVFFKGTKPDLVLVLVCFYAFKHGQARGMTYGALAGLLTDAASGFILGPHIISKALAGFLTATLKDNLFQWNITVTAIVITILSIIDIFIVYVCFETFSKISFSNRPWGISIMEVLYTIIAALVLYLLFNKGKDTGFSDRKL